MPQILTYTVHTGLRTVFLAILLLGSVRGIAQGEGDNWMFGIEAGLNFSSGSPEVIVGSKINSIEACASISDSEGKLMFYAEASKVYNRQHRVMPNGNLVANGNNATQGVGIVPMPGASDKYYVFSLRFSSNSSCALEYAIVDMSKDGRRGEVIEKEIFLRDGITEKMTFVQQTDSPNVWMIVHDFNSDEYSTFLISESGISEATAHATGFTHERRYGYLQPSPDGSMLAAAVPLGFNSEGFIEVSRFDPVNGSISGSFMLEMPGSPYGICFSPDNSKLYATAGSPNHLYQFDLSKRAPDLIQDSRVQITTSPFIDYTSSIGALQLAPDGKIYLARYETKSLAAINQPNALGTDCGYVEIAVSLGEHGSVEGGLPNTGNLFWDQTPAYILVDPEPDEPPADAEPEYACDDLLVKPNPTRAAIVLESFGDEISSVAVYDMTGRLVLPKRVYNSFDVRIDDTAQLAAGTYVVHVAHGGCLNKQKVVVVR